MAEEKKAPISVWTTVKPFVNGGASGMLATCVIQPIDMIKVCQMFTDTRFCITHLYV
jgi:solute carrier family 25 oxoglutarate transporter 11